MPAAGKLIKENAGGIHIAPLIIAPPCIGNAIFCFVHQIPCISIDLEQIACRTLSLRKYKYL